MKLIKNSDRFFIAGGTGMAGLAIRSSLHKNGYHNQLTPSRKELDLLNGAEVEEWMKTNKPDVVVIAAATATVATTSTTTTTTTSPTTTTPHTTTTTTPTTTTKTLAKRYESRKGGYTRIIKAGYRYGDNAPLAIIEFVDRDVEAKRGVIKIWPVTKSPMKK